jgi:hypothetical protein
MRVIAIYFMTMLTSACGSHYKASTLKDEDRLNKPLVIAMSGFSTCRSNDSYHNGKPGPLGGQMFRKVEEFSNHIREAFGVEPVVLSSCFTKGANLIVSSSENPNSVSSPSDEDYLNSLRDVMTQFSNVYVVGHSYGGWLGMKLLETYDGDHDKVEFLYSIDPISRKLCFFTNPKECVTSPKDILDPERRHINEVTKLWVNPWQLETRFLHSSIIPEADENPRLEIDHFDLDTSDIIWSDMKSRITN